MRAIWCLFVQSVLNKFPEVAWDRFTGNEDRLCVFGWIERQDQYKDFLLLTFTDGDLISFATSSARYSKEFSERVGADNYAPCRRVEQRFMNIRIVTRKEDRPNEGLGAVGAQLQGHDRDEAIRHLQNVLAAAEEMHMEINEARGWLTKPSGTEREEWKNTIDAAQAFVNEKDQA